MKSWFELFRISNLPTIWTNIGAGAAIGYLITDGKPVTSTTAVAIVLMIIAGSCLYTGGMVLNDVFDIDIDRAERPHRPLPSERISEAAAGFVGWGLLLAGIGFAAFAGMGNVLPPIVAFAIAVLSVAYNVFHARTALAIAALGLCRGLLYPLGALACAHNTSWDGGGSLILVLTSGAAFVHTIALSLVARGEAEEKPHGPTFAQGIGTIALAVPTGMALVMMLLLLGTDIQAHVWPLPGIGVACALFILLAWLARDLRLLMGTPHRVTGFILGSIAAFCLYDVSIISLLPPPYSLFALIPLLLFLVVHMMHRSIPGT